MVASQPPTDLSGFRIDESGAPVIRVTFPDVVTLPAYERLFDEYMRLCDLYPRVAWLIDMRTFNPVTAPAPIRKAAADVFARSRDRLVQSTVCEARVVESAGVRGVLMAFDWLTGSKWPVRNVATVKDAEVWVAEQLRR